MHDGAGVDKGPHRYEEEGHEDVAEAQHAGQQFVGIVRLADEQAGEERS